MSKVSQAFPKRVVEARAAVRRAKTALRAAEREYDDDRYYGEGNLQLITRILRAERLIEEARARLHPIDPNASE